jgi:8-oxo-dGTP pyrophosphatase MutT (NUDIX family)
MSSKRAKDSSRRRRQFAALPLAEEGEETLVLLVTSRETHRWVLPKGWAEKALSGPELAAKEAFEEAGLVGEIAAEPVGFYRYLKRLPKGHTVKCRVDVFPMRVGQLLEDWPEREQRERRWFTLAQAAMEVEEGELITLLLGLAAPEA